MRFEAASNANACKPCFYFVDGYFVDGHFVDGHFVDGLRWQLVLCILECIKSVLISIFK